MGRATIGPRRHVLDRSCRFGGIVEDVRETQLSPTACPQPPQAPSFSPAVAPHAEKPRPSWATEQADCGHWVKSANDLYAQPNPELSCCFHCAKRMHEKANKEAA